MNEIIQGEILPGQDIVPMDLVQRAVLQGAGVDVLKGLMELHERYEQFRSHKSYAAAIADAKAEFGPITKSRKVDYTTKFGRTRYQHEDMSDIADAIDKPLSKHGLSYRWHTDSDMKAGTVKVTCIVSHRDGFSVENSLTGPFDISGGKNPIQSLGSACTYLERYTLRAALGLVPDEDDDAVSQNPPAGAPRQQSVEDTRREIDEQENRRQAERASEQYKRQAAAANRPQNAEGPRRDNITSGPQPRQEPPPPPRPEPYSVEPPDDIKDNEQWHKWAGVYGRMVRGSQSVEEVDKWRDVNMDLLERFLELEPRLHKEMTDWITLRRTELLHKTPQL
jgi:hypothetical protein